ncbi:MAG: replication initiator protein [Microvirus sp.]|nr:MAG: replication initiator protein [Microvirus sp.]
MTCYFPIPAWKSRDLADTCSKTKKTKLVFKSELGLKSTALEIPCGQCIGCRIDRSREWAIRCVHEASMHDENCFLTLTYAKDPVSLNKRDIVLFLKKLRKKLEPTKIRYFQCGEYGSKTDRPHHHVLLFGYDFPDKVFMSQKNRNNYYVSRSLADLWPHGMHAIGDLTYDSACYTARYILKKMNGDQKESHYGDKIPEFTTQSRKPALATTWLQENLMDIYNHDQCVVSHNLIARPPKYYDRLYDQLHPDRLKTLKAERRSRALSNPENCEERRRVKEKIAQIKTKKLPRPLESGEINTDTEVSEWLPPTADPSRVTSAQQTKKT